MSHEALIDALIDVLEQERWLLSQIEPPLYTALGVRAFKSSIGDHIRHNLDHFTSFFTGLPDGRIDYERRQRDAGIARSIEQALADIEQQIAALEVLACDCLTTSLQVREETDAAVGEARRWLESSVGRELQFMLGHTVHHHAIIALLLAQHGAELPEGFGVAPSTQRHKARHREELGQASPAK